MGFVTGNPVWMFDRDHPVHVFVRDYPVQVFDRDYPVRMLIQIILCGGLDKDLPVWILW